MKKIAILRCLHSNTNCAGIGCLKAFQERTGAFAQYGDEELKLVAYFSCNGCKEAVLNEKGLARKLEALKLEQVEIVHLGSCVKKPTEDGTLRICPQITAIRWELEALGMKMVGGTNRIEEI